MSKRFEGQGKQVKQESRTEPKHSAPLLQLSNWTLHAGNGKHTNESEHPIERANGNAHWRCNHNAHAAIDCWPPIEDYRLDVPNCSKNSGLSSFTYSPSRYFFVFFCFSASMRFSSAT